MAFAFTSHASATPHPRESTKCEELASIELWSLGLIGGIFDALFCQFILKYVYYYIYLYIYIYMYIYIYIYVHVRVIKINRYYYTYSNPTI